MEKLFLGEKVINAKGNHNFSRNYERDRISDWTIHALEQAGRVDDVIPLCIAEAKRTGSYDRLVKQLMAARRYEDAACWIREGIAVTQEKLPGIAAAIQTHAPDRAVDIWKNKAEGLIAQVKPSAYQEAAKYLRKAASIVTRKEKNAAWEQYLSTLRQQHFRKRRLIEILDGLEGKPIIKKRR